MIVSFSITIYVAANVIETSEKTTNFLGIFTDRDIFFKM